MKTDPDETYNTKGSRKSAPGENISPKKPQKANLRGENRNPGKSGNGKTKVGDGNNPFKSALNAGKKK